MRWSISVPLLPDESLSSWLIRTALRQGCDPLTLTGAVWPHWRVWTIDIDRGMPEERLRTISRVSGIPVERIEEAGLRSSAERLYGRQISPSGAWPWILTLGTRNRKRTSGQQFCPDCLAGDSVPYFRKQWRMAWHVGCALHSLRLQNKCHSCGVHLAPHRLNAEDGLITRCFECGMDMRHGTRIPVLQEQLLFQRTAEETCRLGNGLFGACPLPAAGWFDLSHYLAGLVRVSARRSGSRLARSLASLGVLMDDALMPNSGLPMEMLAIDDRLHLLSEMQKLLKVGPDAVAGAFSAYGVTHATLRLVRRELPSALAEACRHIPQVNRRPRALPRTVVGKRPRSRRSVLVAWQRLQRRMRRDAS